ncbi:beta-1 adrenergic receptor-like [Ptychodera flava]|uniref:beta-1 adrenergic receptor-like n=1 Tax=Ptychodera flava TaxID=63121 RepID=UPI00396A8729
MDPVHIDRFIQTTIVCTVCTLAIFGNIINIIVLSRTNKIPVTTCCFMISLAFSDLGVGIFGVFSIPVAITTNWVYGNGWCVFCAIQLHVFLSASIASLLLISVLRFLAIILPFRYLRWFTHRRVITLIIIKWIVLELHAVILGAAHEQFYGYLKHAYICYPRYGSTDFEVITTVSMTVLVFLPSIVIIVIYVRIMRISWVHSRQISSQLSNRDDVTNRNSTTRLMMSDWRNMKAARMFLVVCGGFQVSWYPYAVITTINSMRVFHGGATPWTVFSMVWLGASSSILNVLIRLSGLWQNRQ